MTTKSSNKSALAGALVLTALLCACMTKNQTSSTAGMFGDNYYEPSIERALEIAAKTPDGAKAINYIRHHPVGIKYTALSGPWAKYVPADKIILLPEKTRGTDDTVALLLVRALSAYLAQDSLNLPEPLLETEETAALAQARAAVSYGIPSEKTMAATSEGKQALDEVCTYLIEGQPKFLEMVDRDALSPLPEYGRPLETLQISRRWLVKMQQALLDGTLPQTIYKRDMEKVRKQTMTMDAAVKHAAELRTADPSMLMHTERDIYFRANKTLDDAEDYRRDQLAADIKWRAQNAALINMRITEIHHCQFYIPKFSVAENHAR